MKYIILTKGRKAIICDCHYYLVANHKWCYTPGGYAVRNDYPDGIILMHRIINNTPSGLYTDHINRNKLDNRCSNLRNSNNMLNQQNIGKKSNNKSGFKGVSWSKVAKKWHSTIQVAGKRKHLGYFISILDASEAYNEAASHFFHYQ